VHLIPSCGSLIGQVSVAAGANGFVFNVDGMQTLDSTTGPQAGSVNNVNCVYANYVDATNSQYVGHTQLARVKTSAVGGDPNQPGSSNATFFPMDVQQLRIVDLPDTGVHCDCFAGGPGKLHIYGPFDLAKPVAADAPL
jgi:hypothetical protein